MQNILNAKKVYMIGIKGVGMTMLAQYLAGRGIKVAGSDVPETFMTDEVLYKTGIKIKNGFSKQNIPNDADLIIYSTAYNKNNEEVEAALAGRIPIVAYAQALGEIFNQKFGIAICGSHGKTTTTAWLGYILAKSSLHPSVLVGANVPQFKGTCLVGQSDYFVIEADEYQNKFKYFQPKAVVLNNIDYDHPDFFATEEDYKGAFVEFIGKIPRRGFLIANFDDSTIRKIANVNCRGRIISYAINEAADYIAYDIKENISRQYFKLKFGAEDENDEGTEVTDRMLGEFSVSLPGRHNIYNALAVIAACIELNVPLALIRKHLEEFCGTTRRIEKLGTYNGAIVIDDYAHHPTEIRATLSAVKKGYAGRKIIVVFHPHTYTRTKAFLEDFASSFSDADEIVILDIYGSARERQGGVSSLDLVGKINARKAGKKAVHMPTLYEAEKFLRGRYGQGDVILLMGAGDVFRIGQNLVK